MSETKSSTADEVKELTDKLEQGIKDLYESDRYKDYLKVMSQLPNYSVNNQILIMLQQPEASLVMGYKSWEKLDRHVKKGERGIRIIAPCPYKVKKDMEKMDPHTQQPVMGRDGTPLKEQVEVTVPAYKVISVFSQEQTEGKELPEIAYDLTKDVDGYSRFMEALKEVSPVPVEIRHINGGTHGFYSNNTKTICLAEGMSQEQAIKTLCHELGHAILHDRETGKEKDKRPDRSTMEVEAESVAYTVCQHFGIDSSDYSFGYVAGWARDKELSQLKDSLSVIRSTAAEIIDAVEKSLYRAREQELEKEIEPVKTEERTMEEAKARTHGRHH